MSIPTASALLALLPTAQESAPAPDPPALLAVPADWTFERLELPLTFAPELAFDGFEDLAFAPGMFEPGAPGHWSYALALRLDGDVAVDGPWLAHFFETYYRGLCRAVGGGRGLAIEPADVSASVVSGEDADRLAVELFDVFADGAPLALRLELDVRATPDATEVCGIASPAPADAEIWDELRAVRAAWRAERPPAVYLNHLFWVPDPETYAALASSELLRHLAVGEERHTVRRDLEYTGLYAYGQRTYFEFLKPDGGPLAPGASGIAFGHEAAGGIDRFAAALDAAGIRSFAGQRTRALDGVDVPWFRILGLEAAHAESRLTLFSMEYEPAFLERWHADPDGSGEGRASRRRADVLRRYAASLGASERRAEQPLVDVTTVHLELEARERARFEGAARAAAFALEADGDATLARGPGVTFRVRATDGPGGVTGFDARLRAPLAHEPVALGRVRIELVGDEAHFRFEPE